MACDNSTAAEAALVAAMTGPKSVSSDAGTVEQQPLADLIAADKYLSAKCAASSTRRGLRITQLVPPGAV